MALPTLEYKQNSNTKWPISASLDGVELLFSGVFSPVRAQQEKTSLVFTKLSRVLAWGLVGLGMVGFLYSGYELFYLEYDLFFVFRHHAGNFFAWLGVLSGLYLWAGSLYEEAERSVGKALSLAKLAEWKQSNSSVDVFAWFTDSAKEVWGRIPDPQFATPAVLLQSLLQDKTVQLAFLRFGVNPETIADILKKENILKNPNDSVIIYKLPFAALSEALRLKNRAIDPLMLLSALIEQLPDQHPIARMFFALDFTAEKLEIIASWIFHLQMLADEDRLISRVARHRSDKGINRALTAVPTPYLNQFSKDLTLDAKYHHLPLTWGRGEDTEEALKLLGQGRNVLILGRQGTGRRTLLYDLAYKMVGEQVPVILQDKRLVELELAGILGSKAPPEQVIVNLFSEAEKSGNLVFALPDAHALARAVGSEGLPILEVFLSHLANSRVQVVATATPESFQTILKEIPRISELLAVYELKSLDHFSVMIACAVRASELEFATGAFFQYQALEEAVALTDSISSQNAGQPEKAIEVLTLAAQAVKGLPSAQRLITKTSIQKIVAEQTHVPVEALSSDESDKLLNLESELGRSVIGQKEAVVAVSEALRRARSGLASSARPLASFLFVGPTGVGKTELAKTLARVYFGKSEYMLRLDMSEYQGSDGLRKLLGENAQSSTSFVTHLKTYPFCLFLLDELEKASDEVLNLFLQVLEDGRLTTAGGETLDLTHTIIIATSNAGTKEIQEGLKSGQRLTEIKARLVEAILIKHYRPEFMNRFDGIILFSPLSPSEVEQITRLQLKTVSDMLYAQKIRISFTDKVVAKIATEAFDPLLGARPVRRYIQDHIESVIAKLLLSKQLTRGGEAVMDVSENGEFVVK